MSLAMNTSSFVLMDFCLCVCACRRSLATVAVADRLQEETACDRLQGLVRKQKGLCKRNLEVMGAVRNGAKMAIDECQHQFKNRRWNCSTVDSVALFGNVLKTGMHATSNRYIEHETGTYNTKQVHNNTKQVHSQHETDADTCITQKEKISYENVLT